jgi:hypothetical protein
MIGRPEREPRTAGFVGGLVLFGIGISVSGGVSGLLQLATDNVA